MNAMSAELFSKIDPSSANRPICGLFFLPKQLVFSCEQLLFRDIEEVFMGVSVHSRSCKPISELNSVICHMKSHSVTYSCHMTQENVFRLALTSSTQAGKPTLITYPRGMEG